MLNNNKQLSMSNVDQQDTMVITTEFAEWIAERDALWNAYYARMALAAWNVERDALWNAYYENLAAEAGIILRATRDEVNTPRNGA